MPVSWKSLSRGPGLRVERDGIIVRLGQQRRQKVFVEQPDNESIRLWTVVATRRVVDDFPDAELLAWRRNRLQELVGFTVDVRDRLLGETWLPVRGLTRDELQFAVKTLARASDRFEYLITGSDAS